MERQCRKHNTVLSRSWLSALFVTLLFLVARGGVLAHAATYGSTPHKHDGKICIVSILADEEHVDLAMPPDGVELPVRIAVPVCYFTQTYADLHTPVLLTQSARSPPK